MPTELEDLKALFEVAGARDPESWAQSQIKEGIPQLHRFVFLRQAWSHVLDERSPAWIDRHISEAQKAPGSPFSGVGAALVRAREAGVSTKDLTEIARGVQAELLFQLCYMLEDNGVEEPELEGVSWGLFQTDDEGNAVGPIYGLHESVLDVDPTGREMRPTDDA